MNARPLPVVAYEPDQHAGALFRFIEKVLGADVCARRRRIIESMHADMPGRDRFPLRHVIVDGDRVAGTLGYMPAEFHVDGRRVPARFTHDLLVDPDYRGAGLAKLIVGNALGLGDFFPGGMWMTDPCYKIHVTCGFDEATPLTTYSLVLDPSSFVRRKQMSVPKAVAGKVGLSVTSAYARYRARRAAGDSVDVVERFDAAFDPVWVELATGYGVTRSRDAAYLNWKYADHPTLPYRCLVAAPGKTPAGYMIWRPSPDGAEEKRAVVADFLVRRGDADTLKELLARVIEDAGSDRMESISFLTSQAFAEKVLRSFGFLPRAARNTWVVGGWKNVMPAGWLNDLDAWHVCLGDSDGDIWTGSM